MLHQRLVLAGAVILVILTRQADAASSFSLSSECVNACVASSGCESKDTKCVCKAAQKDDFLETVVTCMYYHCKDDLRGVDNLFLEPVKGGCEADKKAIPKKEMDEAKKTASSLIAKLPKMTTSTSNRPLPVPTQTRLTSTTTRTTQSSSSSSSRTLASPSEPPPPPARSPTTFVPPSTITSGSSPPDVTLSTIRGGPQGVPTDSSPFATLDSPSARIDVPWLMQSLIFLLALGL